MRICRLFERQDTVPCLILVGWISSPHYHQLSFHEQPQDINWVSNGIKMGYLNTSYPKSIEELYSPILSQCHPNFAGQWHLLLIDILLTDAACWGSNHEMYLQFLGRQLCRYILQRFFSIIGVPVTLNFQSWHLTRGCSLILSYGTNASMTHAEIRSMATISPIALTPAFTWPAVAASSTTGGSDFYNVFNLYHRAL